MKNYTYFAQLPIKSVQKKSIENRIKHAALT